MKPACQHHIDALRREQHRLFKVSHARTQQWSVAARRAGHARIQAVLDCWYQHQSQAVLGQPGAHLEWGLLA